MFLTGLQESKFIHCGLHTVRSAVRFFHGWKTIVDPVKGLTQFTYCAGIRNDVIT